MWFGNCKGIPQINTQGRCQYRQIMILTPLLIIEKRFNRFYLLYKFLWRGPVQVRRLYVCGRLSLGITFLYIARPPPLQSEARCFFGLPLFHHSEFVRGSRHGVYTFSRTSTVWHDFFIFWEQMQWTTTITDFLKKRTDPAAADVCRTAAPIRLTFMSATVSAAAAPCSASRRKAGQRTGRNISADSKI